MRIKRGLIIGDSIGWTLDGTSGGGGGDNTTTWNSQLWSHVMVRALDLLYPNSKVKLVNRSYGGQTSAGAVARLAGCIQFPFDFAFFSLGTNDTAGGQLSPTVTQANLTAMVNRTRYERGPTLPILLCAPPNTSDSSRTPTIAATQAAVAATVASFASAPGVGLVRFQDAWATANNATYLGGDGIHPNSAGHALMGALAVTALVSVAGSLLSSN